LEQLPKRLGIALAKYHSIVFVMRIYEHIAAKYVDSAMLDRLTLDTFATAKRESDSGNRGLELGQKMVEVCGYANAISFLADFTVHQVILLFGFYMYIRENQAKRVSTDEEENVMHYGSLTLSVLKRSAFLALSRAVGLVSASVGGGLGTMIKPGWGTLAGINLFDSISAALTDDMVNTAPA
jgi:hypothetical protein